MYQAPAMREALLGFDLRELFIPPDTAWTAERRATYLLREGVRKPLSVDPRVWPSLFGEDFPGWRGPNAGLWDDLSRMRKARGVPLSKAHEAVAVGWISGDGFSTASPLGPFQERMAPPTASDDWSFLGFDVADAGFISGLTNCGYGAGERDGLRATWRQALNVHHLFSGLDEAFAFKAVADRRVLEHAPFFVYSLWLIPRP
jgi:hypothetical protein